jgi:hypothetical protein
MWGCSSTRCYATLCSRRHRHGDSARENRGLGRRIIASRWTRQPIEMSWESGHPVAPAT